MTEQPNDGFGNEPTTAELAATSEDPGETSEGQEAGPKEQMTRLSEELRMRDRVRRPVNVDPRLASGGRGGASYGPIRGQALIETQDPGPDLGIKMNQAGVRRMAVASRLERLGFVRVRVDRWMCPESNVSVEMGCSLEELWIRAYWPDAHKRHEQWVFIDHINLSRGAVVSEENQSIDKILGMRLAVQSGRINNTDYGLAPAPVQQTLGFKLLVEGAKLPTRAHDDDAGFDLYLSQDVVIKPGEYTRVPCGVSVGLPRGFWARITGRSSAMSRHGLMVNEGIIDQGYTGELFAGVRNLNETVALIRAGERLAQLIIHRNETEQFTPVEVNEHPPTARGANGFGSSGR